MLNLKPFCPSGYARAEVDKIVVKDADNFEYKQELEYRVSNMPIKMLQIFSNCPSLNSLNIVDFRMSN